MVIATMDEARREIPGGFILIDGPAIIRVGTAEEVLPEADEVIDLSGHVVLPGLRAQTLGRAVCLDENRIE